MKTLLVDGNNVLARADFAARGKHVAMSSGETNTAALVIFIRMLSKYVRLFEPTHMAVFWDAGHDMRDEVFAGYKANRKKAEPGAEDTTPFALAKEFLSYAGVPHKAVCGWEADDLIAATVRQCPDEVAIVSGDKDLLQLLGAGLPGGRVVQYKIPEDEPWTVSRYCAQFGYGPSKAAMVHALVGDTSDGVPGLPGIGPKKAVKALTEAHWDWETLLTQLGPEKAAVAVQMRSLVDLRDLDYPQWLMEAHRGAPEFAPTLLNGTPWGDRLRDFCQRYQLKTVIADLEAGTLWHGSETPKPSSDTVFADLDF